MWISTQLLTQTRARAAADFQLHGVMPAPQNPEEKARLLREGVASVSQWKQLIGCTGGIGGRVKLNCFQICKWLAEHTSGLPQFAV